MTEPRLRDRDSRRVDPPDAQRLPNSEVAKPELRDGLLLQQIPPEDGDLLFGTVDGARTSTVFQVQLEMEKAFSD